MIGINARLPVNTQAMQIPGHCCHSEDWRAEEHWLLKTCGMAPGKIDLLRDAHIEDHNSVLVGKVGKDRVRQDNQGVASEMGHACTQALLTFLCPDHHACIDSLDSMPQRPREVSRGRLQLQSARATVVSSICLGPALWIC